MRYKATTKILTIVALFLFLVFNLSSVSASNGKISTSQDNLTIDEGSSQDIQLNLDAPIICPVNPNPCNVSLTFTSSDPQRVSVSPNPVVWDNTEWPQVRTITINTVNNGYYTPDEDVTVSATAVSSALYYSNFPVSVQLVVHSINAPPAPSIVNQNVQLQSNSSIAVNVLSGVGNNPNPSTLAIVSGPSHGIAVDPPGTITYTPNQGYVGTDSLIYTVCSSIDSSVCSDATLNFNILANVNTAISKSGASTVTTPNTGYGIPADNATYTLLLLGSSITLIAIGLSIRRLKA